MWSYLLEISYLAAYDRHCSWSGQGDGTRLFVPPVYFMIWFCQQGWYSEKADAARPDLE